MKKIIVLLIMTMVFTVEAQERLKNFRGTAQTAAILGLSNEFVDSSLEQSILLDLRKGVNKFTKSHEAAAINNFELGQNPNKQFFKPTKSTLSDAQKDFLTAAGKKNSIDIIILGGIREGGEGIEMDLQAYDVRIDSLSAVETEDFKVSRKNEAIEKIVYRVMNHLDREGFVHPTKQEFLQPPIFVADKSFTPIFNDKNQELSLDPTKLGGGMLAGDLQIGGEKTPFWERWWFWTLIGGGLITAGGLGYYFLVVDQPDKTADISFQF